MTRYAELWSVTTYDGTTYNLNQTRQMGNLGTPGSMGLPTINYVTQRTYKQDGVTEQAFYLQPRTIAMEWTLGKCSRQEYWEARQELLNIFRPNRGGSPGYLTLNFVRYDGQKFSIRARSQTPRFAATDNETWDEFGITETLEFECFDPTWFNPAVTAATISSATPANLVFPITFPIVFDSGDLYQKAIITYTGTWYAYPTITITGPCDSFQIEHQELDIFLIYTLSVAAGETLTLNLQDKTLVSSIGTDQWGGLAPLSEVQRFRIEPSPIVTNGVNTIRFYAPGSGVGTNFTLSYNTRYVGI